MASSTDLLKLRSVAGIADGDTTAKLLHFATHPADSVAKLLELLTGNSPSAGLNYAALMVTSIVLAAVRKSLIGGLDCEGQRWIARNVRRIIKMVKSGVQVTGMVLRKEPRLLHAPGPLSGTTVAYTRRAMLVSVLYGKLSSKLHIKNAPGHLKETGNASSLLIFCAYDLACGLEGDASNGEGEDLRDAAWLFTSGHVILVHALGLLLAGDAQLAWAVTMIGVGTCHWGYRAATEGTHKNRVRGPVTCVFIGALLLLSASGSYRNIITGKLDIVVVLGLLPIAVLTRFGTRFTEWAFSGKTAKRLITIQEKLIRHLLGFVCTVSAINSTLVVLGFDPSVGVITRITAGFLAVCLLMTARSFTRPGRHRVFARTMKG